MNLPIALYVPNLLCYARILAAFLGMNFARRQPALAVGVWIFSASLDLFDGMLARALNQSSSLGVLLDIVADITLRSVTWIAATMAEPSHGPVAGLVISLEWTTMVATQLHAAQSGSHWKKQRENDPWLVRSIFANNFRRPLGIWAIYGLFSSGLFAFGTHHQTIVDAIPYFEFFKYLAYSGRLLSSIVEIWLTLGYVKLVIERDSEAPKKAS